MPASEGVAPGMLAGVRVLEVGDEKGEFCGKLLAGAGAEVVRVEPPGGASTRRLGPHVDDRYDPERSLHFWHFNTGKLGLTLDLTSPRGREVFADLAAHADVLVDSLPVGTLASAGLGYDDLAARHPGLVMAAITPFGQDGPYRDWRGSDLVHLALGGAVSQTGYEPETGLPPVAPQVWHSIHITGNLTFVAIVACLIGRERTGHGDFVDMSVHRAVSFSTVEDVPYWLFHRQEVARQRSRYAAPQPWPDPMSPTKDGRHLLTYHYLPRHYTTLRRMLQEHGVVAPEDQARLDAHPDDAAPEAQAIIEELVRRWVAETPFDSELWKEAQRNRLNWAPVRRPEENLDDHHWFVRGALGAVEHEDLGRSLVYCDRPWSASASPWRGGVRAPHTGEHTEQVLRRWLDLEPSAVEALASAGVV